ncbi:hypothetical protein [Mycolicibacterium sp. S3B2]|uniref:hypothetical protein n=1 Tax=Mycolicibacterium sp. S3B2 TaxID=3415120 RepID=UPI003C7BD094
MIYVSDAEQKLAQQCGQVIVCAEYPMKIWVDLDDCEPGAVLEVVPGDFEVVDAGDSIEVFESADSVCD